MSTFDAIVVGGGLIGMLTARELALGGLKTAIVERNETGRESSWAGGGILSPLHPWRYSDPVNDLAEWSQRFYPQFAEQLAQETGTDPEWTQSGMVILDIEADERDEAVSWAFQFGYELEYLGNEAVLQQNPALRWDGTGAIWMPTVAQVRNPRLLQALRKHIDALGVAVLVGETVTEIEAGDGHAPVVVSQDGRLSARNVVVAGGAWSGELLGSLGISLPIEPVRGQMLLIESRPDLIEHIILSGNRYLIPRLDGHILVGSTIEHTGFEKMTTEEARADLAHIAYSLVPELERYPIVQHWAGLRPGSPDGVPFIGPIPGSTGVYVNSGHFRNGVVTGPASAKLVADLILDRPPLCEPAAYSPAERGHILNT